jgi:hypothetical protein
MIVEGRRFCSKTWKEFATKAGEFSMPQPTRNQVFISYSHKDSKWRDELEIQLKPYLLGGSIVSWSDQQIAPGSEWFKEIQSALVNSRVAVLLVTPAFIASDFIHEHELGPLLKEATRGGVKILWIPVRESGYKKTPLKDYKAAVLDPSKPLAAMTQAGRDKAWVKICEEIEKAIDSDSPPTDDTRQKNGLVLHVVHPLLSARDWQDRPQFGQLCEWWQEGGCGICVLVGIGGSGKTAIANRFLKVLPGVFPEPADAVRRPDLPSPDRLLVFSFYDAPNPEEFFAELVSWLDEKPTASFETGVSYQHALRLLGRSARCLLVLDGLEKVQEDGGRGGNFGQLLDGRLGDLVRRLAGGWLPNVGAIITTRFPIAELEEAFYEKQARYYRAIAVEEISETAAKQLLRERGGSRQRCRFGAHFARMRPPRANCRSSRRLSSRVRTWAFRCSLGSGF